MRILKYIFILLFLFLIGLTVFVITQKGDYDVIRTKIIKSNKSTVYSFVNDYKNWEIFYPIAKNQNIDFNYSNHTAGKGAFLSWTSQNNSGKINTIYSKENDSIFQKMSIDDCLSDVYIVFKDTLGQTKVTWRTKGKMSVFSKITHFLKGGIESSLGDISEKTLENLDKSLDYEINTYSIKINGLASVSSKYYIGQTINSKSNKVVKNVGILVPKMLDFFEKNQLKISGKPFVKYNKTDYYKDIINLSICVPIKDSVFIMQGSDVFSGKLESFTAIKITLTGDYSHLKEAQNKGIAFIAKNKLKQNFSIPVMEVYTKSIKDVKNPSQWVTEVYIPVFPKTFFSKSIYKTNAASPVNIGTPALPSSTPVEEQQPKAP